MLPPAKVHEKCPMLGVAGAWTTGLVIAFADNIIEYIQEADSIQIFGPAEAKGELVKHLKSKNLRKQIVGIETTDKLTDPQITAKVRQYYPR